MPVAVNPDTQDGYFASIPRQDAAGCWTLVIGRKVAGELVEAVRLTSADPFQLRALVDDKLQAGKTEGRPLTAFSKGIRRFATKQEVER